MKLISPQIYELMLSLQDNLRICTQLPKLPKVQLFNHLTTLTLFCDILLQ